MSKKKRIKTIVIMLCVVIVLAVLSIVIGNDGKEETIKETMKDAVLHDENKISLGELIRYYFMVIDPVAVNRQGNDVGIQYRTGIYYTDPDMLCEIRKVYDEEEKRLGTPLAVEVLPLENFFSAEEYHQKYLEKNPHGYCHIAPSYFKIAQNMR